MLVGVRFCNSFTSESRDPQVGKPEFDASVPYRVDCANASVPYRVDCANASMPHRVDCANASVPYRVWDCLFIEALWLVAQ